MSLSLVLPKMDLKQTYGNPLANGALDLARLRKSAGTDRLLDWLLNSPARFTLRRKGKGQSTALASFWKSKAESISGTKTALFLVKTFYSPASYSTRTISGNRPGSLQLLFNYYSTLLQPSQVFCGTGVARCLTYADIQLANTHVSLPELTRFAKTFGIIPHLLSLQGVHYAWQRQKFENVGRENSTMLDYDGFVEVLARCALLAFPDLEDPRDRVKALALFLDLKNTRKYRKAIATMKRFEQIKIDPTENFRDGPPACRNAPRASRSEKNATASSRNVVGQNPDMPTADRTTSRTACNDYNYVPISKPKWKSIRVGKRLAKYIPRKTAVSLSKGSSSKRAVYARDTATRTKGPRVSVPSKSKRAFLRKERWLPHAAELVPAKTPTFAARTKVAFCKQDVHYTGNLLEELQPYHVDDSPIRWLPYDEPSIDMGKLRLGSTYRYKINVLNTMSHKTAFEFYVHNLPGSSITYDAKDAAAGIERTAIVKIQAIEEGEFLGAVQCVARTTCGDEVEQFLIPAYCTVERHSALGSPLHKTNSPIGPESGIDKMPDSEDP